MADKKIILISGLLIALSIPITISLLRLKTNKNSHAAAADKLEAESGVLGGNAKPQSDSNASGGQYVAFINASQTPTPTPNSQACQATFTQAPSITSDQSSAISSFLTSNSDKVVCFTPAAVYRVDAKITLNNWTGTILGQGSTFKRYITSDSQSAHIKLVYATNVTIDGLNISGPANLSDIQNRIFGTNDKEDQHAFDLESSTNVTIKNATLSNLWGDGVYLRSVNYNGDNSPTQHVVLQNLVTNIIGRNCVSIISTVDLLVDKMKCSNVSLHGLDGEPNKTTDIVSGIKVQNSDWRTFDAGHTPSGPGYAIVLTPGYADVQSADIYISNNTMDKARVRVDGYSSTKPALRVTVTGNRPEQPGTATFAHIRGFTFSDNGPMTSSTSDVQ